MRPSVLVSGCRVSALVCSRRWGPQQPGIWSPVHPSPTPLAGPGAGSLKGWPGGSPSPSTETLPGDPRVKCPSQVRCGSWSSGVGQSGVPPATGWSIQEAEPAESRLIPGSSLCDYGIFFPDKLLRSLCPEAHLLNSWGLVSPKWRQRAGQPFLPGSNSFPVSWQAKAWRVHCRAPLRLRGNHSKEGTCVCGSSLPPAVSSGVTWPQCRPKATSWSPWVSPCRAAHCEMGRARDGDTCV